MESSKPHMRQSRAELQQADSTNSHYAKQLPFNSGFDACTSL